MLFKFSVSKTLDLRKEIVFFNKLTPITTYDNIRTNFTLGVIDN